MDVIRIGRNPQTTICPVRAIEQYIQVARQVCVDRTCGYLFRPKGIQDSPHSTSTAEVQLKNYLKEMNIDEAETLHGF